MNSTLLFVFVEKYKRIIGHTIVVLNVIFPKKCIIIYLTREHYVGRA